MTRLIVSPDSDASQVEIDTEDPSVIVAELATVGVRFEQWKASHLLADTLTKVGVRWLLPIFNYSFKVPLISTGSASGNLLEVGICVGYALLVLGLVVGGMHLT